MKYYLFLDESGDECLSNIRPDFPLFLLCGVLTSVEKYELIRTSFDEIKQSFWGTKEVIFHSRDIRKCQKEFHILSDTELKMHFYESLNHIISNCEYTIIASAIKKLKILKELAPLEKDVYEVALSMAVEQAIFIINQTSDAAELNVVIECRGLKEDKRLYNHFQRLLVTGTEKITVTEIEKVSPGIIFLNKLKNINGLQLADLVAYPLARYVISPEKENPAFKILEPKIYRINNLPAGLRIFP